MVKIVNGLRRKVSILDAYNEKCIVIYIITNKKTSMFQSKRLALFFDFLCRQQMMPIPLL